MEDTTAAEGPKATVIIEPTVGRVVWLCEVPGTERRLAAIIAYVHNERMVNLMVIADRGSTFGMSSVLLRQPEDADPSKPYCEWMPHQVGQAAKTQTTEKKIVRIGERLHDMRERFDASQEMLIERLVILEAQLDRVVPVVTAMFAAPTERAGR